MKNSGILILGWGISGKGAAALARKLGKTPVPVDSSIPENSSEIADAVFGWKEGIPLPDAEFAVISPGIPIASPMARAVLRKGIPVIGELEFAWRNSPCRMTAVTGTNGKTTTTELTAALLNACGVKAQSAGNIGNSLSEAVMNSLDGSRSDLLVVEVSSFQLETVRDFAPSSGAWLNLASDHLNRHGTMEEYARTKMKLFRNMKKTGTAVLNANLPERYVSEIRGICGIRTFSASVPADYDLSAGWIRRGGRNIIRLDSLPLKGLHNAENVMAALALLEAECGENAVFSESVRSVLTGFKPEPHRMEFFAEAGGIRFADDSKATNPHSVNAALKTFGGNRNVLLILGGSDKKMDFSSIAEDADKVKAAFLIGESAEKIYGTLRDAFPCELCGTMENAVRKAIEKAEPGDIVALSPACASFDQFRGYKDRGEKFKQAVRSALAEKESCFPCGKS